METIRIINFIITAIFAVCYSYQFLYVPVSLWFQGRDKRHMLTTSFARDTSSVTLFSSAHATKRT